MVTTSLRRHSCSAAACFVLAAAAGVSSTGLAAQATSALPRYDFEPEEPRQFDLSRSLREVSGLAMDAQGALFAHQDERGVVFQLDPASGRTLRTFRLGRSGVRGDFEGIALASGRMYMISSTGGLVEFREGADDTSVEYERADTGSRRMCGEVEGLDYDAVTDALLLACKVTSGRARRDRLVVLSFPLATRELASEPRLSIPLDFLDGFGLEERLRPSGIAIHPITGTIFVVAARENLLVEVDRGGSVLGVARLDRRAHHQAEGIAFGRDGTLYIADEGRSGRATLTVYPFAEPTESPGDQPRTSRIDPDLPDARKRGYDRRHAAFNLGAERSTR